MSLPVKIHIVDEWLLDNQKYFTPPVCNKLMYDQQLKVFFVGGPNSRKDYHLEEGEEFFFMIKGDMCLKVVEQGVRRDVWIREGEAFLLPSRVPHSPQRFRDTLGLVIERERAIEEMDAIRFYASPTSSEILYDKWFYCHSLDDQLPSLLKQVNAIVDQYLGDTQRKVLRSDNASFSDSDVKLMKPFKVSEWIDRNTTMIQNSANGKSLFKSGTYSESNVRFFGGGIHDIGCHVGDAFLWSWSGQWQVQWPHDKRSLFLTPGQCVCLPAGVSYKVANIAENKMASNEISATSANPLLFYISMDKKLNNASTK